MNKQEIAAALEKNYHDFEICLSHLSDHELSNAPEGKWSALKQLDHLKSSVSAVNLVFKLPAFIVKWRFGKANRPSKTYAQLVEKYENKLKEANNPPARFQPKEVGISDQATLLKELQNAVTFMKNGMLKMSEEKLDVLILPHPLLGKLTLREMLYFTIYHAEYHEHLVKKYVAQLK
jgi:hypothetical protein